MRLIDADALKEYIGAVRAEFNFFDDDERPRYEAHSKAIYLLDLYVDSAPTIDAVSVVHGEWIESNLIKDGRIFICSNCNMAWVSKKRTMDGMNYCPNCGARMDGERKEKRDDKP